MKKLMIALVALVVMIGLGGWFLMTHEGGAATASVKTEAKDDTTGDETECLAEYRQEDITDPKLKRFVKGGVDAKTAAKSSNKILAAAGKDASTLHHYAAVSFGLPDVPAAEDLLTEDGVCLSEAGVETLDRLGDIMSASGQDFSEVPAWGYNSGVDANGNPVVAAKPGITGNRKAVMYTLPNGSVVYILVRCGNPAYPSQPPGIPPGDTDNPPDEEPPDETEEKKPWKGSGPRGNAPEGSGQNEDTGPGEYKAPKDMDKPGKDPYVPPSTPTPTPGSGNSGTGGTKPTPDPTPPPPPEPSAPPTDKPETGCTPIPGVEDCK